jgi:hypothetical protein
MKPLHSRRWMFLVFFTYILSMITAVDAQEKVIVKAFNKNSCYKPGENIEVYGTGFGDNKKSFSQKKLVMINGGKPFIISSIKQWSNDKIVAALPTKINGASDKYIVGITQSSSWVSNRDRTITLCRSKSPAAVSNLTLKPKSVPPKTPTAELPKVVIPKKRMLPGATRPKTPIISIKPKVTPEEGDASRGVISSVTIDETSQYYEERSSGSLSGLGPPPKVSAIFTADDEGESQEKPQELKEALVATATMEEATVLAAFLKQYNISVKRRSRYPHLGVVVSVLRIPEELEAGVIIQQLRENNSSLWIDFNHRYQLLGSTSSNRSLPDFKPDPKLWAYDKVGLSQINTCKPSVKSPPIKIGVIDTGIAPQAPINQSLIIRQPFLPNGTKVAKTDHGTAIGSLLLGSASHSIPGLVPTALLYSAAIFRSRNKETIDTTSELIIKALNWLAGEEITTINMSLGGPRNLIVELVLNRLIKNGFTIVSAAGVDKNNNPLYPAAQKGVIAVRAIDANNKVFTEKIQGDYIDFAAPGVDLWLLNAKGKAKYQSGSSFAAPFVTASMSFLNKNESSYKQLKKTAKDLGVKGKDRFFGWGLTQAVSNCL